MSSVLANVARSTPDVARTASRARSRRSSSHDRSTSDPPARTARPDATIDAASASASGADRPVSRGMSATSTRPVRASSRASSGSRRRAPRVARRAGSVRRRATSAPATVHSRPASRSTTRSPGASGIGVRKRRRASVAGVVEDLAPHLVLTGPDVGLQPGPAAQLLPGCGGDGHVDDRRRRPLARPHECVTALERRALDSGEVQRDARPRRGAFDVAMGRLDPAHPDGGAGARRSRARRRRRRLLPPASR